MAERPFDKNIPVWRETPLDHWSTDIDPALMAGDEWVDKADVGNRRLAEQQGGSKLQAPFMHPMHDVSYGLEDDRPDLDVE